jgi:hypothetical protein
MREITAGMWILARMSTTETQKPCIAARSCHPGWDAQTNGRPRAGIAVAVTPGSQRTAQARESACEWLAAEAQSRPARWTPEWREALVEGLAYFIAAQQLPGSWFPALGVPRFVHGQSQGICDLFGARVERQNDGNYYVHPLPTDPSRIAAMAPNALPASLYWGAVEWLAYARAATQGRVSFRNPVMTGPLDTANYLLGTTVLMEWVYTEPQALHRLLDRITVTLIGMMRELQRAVGGVLHGDALLCVRNAFCLCSECRSLVSTAVSRNSKLPIWPASDRPSDPTAFTPAAVGNAPCPAPFRTLNCAP